MVLFSGIVEVGRWLVLTYPGLMLWLGQLSTGGRGYSLTRPAAMSNIGLLTLLR